jgi:hypothetical protein
MSDANWGPRDATQTKSKQELTLFVSCSMSAFYIDEAEIYATDECLKFLLELVQLLEFLQVKQLFMPTTSIIYNDNQACINWLKRCTTKGLHHIQTKENRVRENASSDFVQIHHINGKVNLADLFTKEMQDTTHFVELRDIMMKPRIYL